MKVLANLGLLLLLVLALGAVGTAAVWRFSPELVETADQKWVGHHTGAPLQKLSELRALAKTDRKAALAGLETLTAELRTALKADNRYPIRRRALMLQAELLFAEKDLERARATADEMLEHYANDVGMRLWLCGQLCAHGETRADGLAHLDEIYQRVPELGVVARNYHDAALKGGDEALAQDVLVRHLDRALRTEQSLIGVTAPWQIWWSADGTWSTERRIDVTALRYGNITAVPFELPEAATTLRLDPPASSHLAYGTPRLGVFEGQVPAEIPIPDAGLKASDMHMDSKVLLVDGARDPWIQIPLPAEHTGKPLRGRFVFTADHDPVWLCEAAATPTMRAAASGLPEDSRARKRLETARATLGDYGAALAALRAAPDEPR